MVNPIKDRVEVVASPLSVKRLASARVFANRNLRVERSQKHHCKKNKSFLLGAGRQRRHTRYDEELHRQNNEHVIDVETRMTVVECEEAVDGKLCS